jgi:choline dehydrogenase-like flavoprotein
VADRIKRAEVVVVGTGPSGAAAAFAFERAGVEVVALEAGRRPRTQTQHERFAMMENALLGQSPWRFEPYVYEMAGDDVELNTFAIRMLGGSSLAWGAISPRFQPNDFRMRSKYGIASDWPLEYADLEPYYCAAERFIGVSGNDDSPWAAPRSEPFPMPAFPMNDSDRLVSEAGEKLGIRFHSVPVARNSVAYDGRSACSYYGTCRACPIGAMYSSDHTIRLLERSKRFRLMTECEAARIELDSQGRARRVVYHDSEGREQAIEAERIVLATQTVETVRILLNSACGAHPQGLGNDSGTLGRGFMEHAKFYMRGRIKGRVQPWRQGFETATTYKFHDHPRRGEWSGGRLLVRENAGPSPALIAEHSGLWGRELRAEVAEVFGRYITLGAFLEQLPRPDNRISLSPSVKDRHGLPAARVSFKLVSEYEQRGFEEMKKVMLSIFDALDAEDVRVLMPPSNSGHYMGGHAMGTSGDGSVTNSFCEMHGVERLYLAGGGVYPTAGVSNMTLTTLAIVFRMVDHVLKGRN